MPTPLQETTSAPTSGTQPAANPGSPTSSSPHKAPTLGITGAMALSATWPVSRAVLGNFAPLLVARGVAHIFYHALAFFSTAEPWRQLGDPNGVSGAALAGASTFVGVSLDVASFAASVGSAFTSEAIYLDTNYCSPSTFSTATSTLAVSAVNPCWPPRVTQRTWVVDVVIALLVIVAVVLVQSIVLWWRHPGGVAGDPTSIAGVAAVMGNEALEGEFATLPVDMTGSQLKKYLEDRKFVLGEFEVRRPVGLGGDGMVGREGGLLEGEGLVGGEAMGVATGGQSFKKYGIVEAPDSDDEEEEHGTRRRDGQVARTSADGASEDGEAAGAIRRKKKRGVIEKFERGLARTKAALGFDEWKAWRWIVDLIFCVLALTLLGVGIAAVTYVDDPTKLFATTWMEHSAVGMRIGFGLLGVIISWYWGRLFRDAQTFAPYASLMKQPSAARPTILMRRYAIPILAVIPLLRHRHYLPASVAFTAILSEVLIIALAGLPYRSGQLQGEYLFCAVATVIILAAMLVEVVVINVWRWRSVPSLPRRPDSVAAVMTYLAAARMNEDFYGIEKLKVNERNRRIVKRGRMYAYGLAGDGLGNRRWMVDYVDAGEKMPSHSMSADTMRNVSMYR